MSLLNVFDIAGSALSAQTIRLNTVASNLANAETASSRPEDVYRSKQPIFQTVYSDQLSSNETAGVRVLEILEAEGKATQEYNPGHPLADDTGYIYKPAINALSEVANMISASRSYQTNVEVMSTAKQLLLRTLALGK